MLGDAKKNLKRMVDLAEELYEKVNELTRRLEDTTDTVEDTNARVETLESELAAQRALLDAVAEEQGIDVEDVTPEPDDSEEGDSPTDSKQESPRF